MAILSEKRLREIRRFNESHQSHGAFTDAINDLLAAYDEALKERERLREALRYFEQGYHLTVDDIEGINIARAALAEKP